MAKVDLSDGYYRVPLAPEATLHLAVIIPSDVPAEKSLIALPLTLPMGWSHSPPYFCAYAESIADVANSPSRTYPPHYLLQQTQSATVLQASHFHPSAIVLGSCTTPALNYTDIYIDNFMIIAQKPNHLPTMNHLLTTIDQVFHDTQTNRRQIVSASKLQKGDAAFSTFKRILGWDLKTETMTLHLPEAR
jgi:hypothetical protein